jgi:ABC-2 type transport system ATP-binding protein
VVGLLGPNGAGKTTLVRVLTTLLVPDSGHATVEGYDVVKDADALRHVIGLAGQSAAVDDYLTGRENLELVARLYHLPKSEAQRRADALLERFDLVDAGHRQARTYSGGMRRRLDLAASIIAEPPVLFLDEPTTGLDPRSRLGLWEVIRDLVRDGTTVLLTTQYLEEADALADRITVIDHGKVLAEGTTDELKQQTAQAVLSVQVEEPEHLADAVAVLGRLDSQEPQVDEAARRVSVGTAQGSSVIARAVRELESAGVSIADIGLHQPTLDDVFLALTGHSAEDDADQSGAA